MRRFTFGTPIAVSCLAILLSRVVAVQAAPPDRPLLYVVALGPTVYAIDVPSRTIVGEARLGDIEQARQGVTAAAYALFPVRDGQALCLLEVEGTADNGTRPAAQQTTTIVFIDPQTLTVIATEVLHSLDPYGWQTVGGDYLRLLGENVQGGKREQTTRTYRIDAEYHAASVSSAPESLPVTDWRQRAVSYGAAFTPALDGKAGGLVFAIDEHRDRLYAIVHRPRLAADGHVESMGFDRAELWELAAGTLETTHVVSLAGRDLGGYPSPFTSGSPVFDDGRYVVALFPGTGYLAHPAPSYLMVYDRTMNKVEYLELESDALSPVVLAPVSVTSNAAGLGELRPLIQSWGGQVAWNGAAREVSGACHGQDFRLRVGSKTAWLNGASVSLSEPPLVKDGRLRVPQDFLVRLASAALTVRLQRSAPG